LETPEIKPTQKLKRKRKRERERRRETEREREEEGWQQQEYRQVTKLTKLNISTSGISVKDISRDSSVP